MESVAKAMARFLEAHGIELVVGQSLPSALHLELPDTKIRQLQVRTENAGAAICDAYAKVSGRVAVMTAQNGPAALLLAPGLAEALKTSTPILAIVQDTDPAQREKNSFQEFDHFALFSSCAKWVGRLDTAGQLYDLVNLALTHAVTGRPGPSVLLVPPSVFLEKAPSFPRTVVTRATCPLDRPTASRPAIAEAARCLHEAKRPLIVAGGGVHLSGAASCIENLQHEFGFTVATTLMGKGAVSEDHPLSIGVIGYLLGKCAPNREVRDYIDQADVVLFVGARTNQNGTDNWTLYGAATRFLHLDIDGVEVGRNYESVRLVGDARSSLEALTDVLRQICSKEQAAERAAQLERQIPRKRGPAPCATQASCGAVRPEHVMDALNRLAPENAIFAADASYSSAWLCAYGRACRSGQRFLTPRGLAGLGWGLPYLLGAKLADPDATIIGLSGDGGFSHVWSELETAARYQLAFVLIVLKNGILGYQRDAELVKFGRHTNAIPIGEIDHAAIARACGCVGISVEKQSDFEPAFVEAMSLKRSVVLDIRTDPAAFPPVTLLDGLVDIHSAASDGAGA